MPEPVHIEARPFSYPYDGRLRPEHTALMVIDLQIDFLSPDGYFARCHDHRSKSQPWLSCTATEELSDKLAISYDFRSTAELFITQSATVAANARAIFNSLKP